MVRLDKPSKAESWPHLDFGLDCRDADVAQLIAHGARRVDIGPGDVVWVLLADPEGNEFCVLGH